MAIAHSHHHYIPAAGHHWSLPLYDPLTWLIGVDRAREALLADADLHGAMRVLDIGCGTGTLAVSIKRTHPQVEMIGLDPDPDALARAGRKAERASQDVRFDRGMAGELPYADRSIDRVFSSFMFHHLLGEEKLRMLREVRRVLAPEGRLILVDFAGPDRHAGIVTRLLQSHRLMADNVAPRVLALMTGAGLRDPQRVGQRSSIVGRINYYRALGVA